MAIVRELLIRLGFQTDKKAINETNRAITGFKTRFAIAATAATYAFKVIKDFFTDIAAATLDSDELARTLGISLNEFIALQQAAQKFRIKPDQFSGVLATLQKDLYDLIQGFGRLPEIARQLKIEINRDTTPVQLFDRIIEAIRAIEDETQRIKVANELFPGLGAKISSLSQDFEGFKKTVSEAYETLEKQPDIVPQLQSYEQAVNGLGQAFDNLVRTLGKYVFPALEQMISYFEYVSKFWGTLLSGDFTGFKGVLDQGGKKVDSVLDSVAGSFTSFRNWLDPYVTYDPKAPRRAPMAEYGPSWIESQLPASWVNYINNTVDVNVPQGTSTEQAQYLGGEIERMVEDGIMNAFNQIQNNNPVVE